MSEMVERLARILYAQFECGDGMDTDAWDRFDSLTGAVKNERRQFARVLIEAMREPTDAMLKAYVVGETSDYETSRYDLWQGMIDAAR